MKNSIMNTITDMIFSRSMLIPMVLFVLSSIAFADTSQIALRYQQSLFSIKNSAPYPIMVTIDEFGGTWVIPVSIKTPMILAPNQCYKNTLISENTRDGLENYVSIEVAQLGNERENYLIFGESANNRKHYLAAHIFDGLGTIFVHSDTNHCDHNTLNGYAYCELTVKII